jgi:hypothetical protein
MPFITNSNLQRIIQNTNYKSLDLDKEIYYRPIYVFSSNEKKFILGASMFLEEPESFINEMYKPFQKQDTLSFVFESSQPAFHDDSNCDRLNSNFTNFEIPQKIKEAGPNEVERFRNWFKRNMHLLDRPELFVLNLYNAFGVKVNPKSVNYTNSGVIERYDYNISELEDKIDEKIKETGRYYYAGEKNKRIIQRYGKRIGIAFNNERLLDNDTGCSDEEVKTFILDYNTRFKKPLRNLLIEWYRIKLNPDLEFDGSLLIRLGLKPCNQCCLSIDYDNAGSSNTEENNEGDDLPF